MALPAEARNMKVKARLPVPSIATSGRWNKRADGEWGFDLDDLPSSNATSGSEETAATSLKSNADATSDDDDDNNNAEQSTISKNLNNLGENFSAGLKSQNTDSNYKTRTDSGGLGSEMQTITNNSNMQQIAMDQAASLMPIHLVLRMRDEKRELQDIKFDFLPNKDTVDEISHELVNAKLIDSIDMIVVSLNLRNLLENHSLSPITFPLVMS